MSVEAVKWALYGAPMLLTDKGKPDTTARQVLAVLAEHAGPDGADAFPSSLKITFATGLDERTVQRALVRLERGGQVARDGVSKHGTTRWKLALSVTRPESEWPQMQAEADRARRAESDARSARRRKARETETDTDLSGTQNPGQPGRRMPDTETGADLSGTQSAGCPGRRVPDVRDAAPPEPPEQPPVQPPVPRGSSVIPSDSPSDASPPAPRATDPQQGFTEEKPCGPVVTGELIDPDDPFARKPREFRRPATVTNHWLASGVTETRHVTDPTAGKHFPQPCDGDADTCCACNLPIRNKSFHLTRRAA